MLKGNSVYFKLFCFLLIELFFSITTKGQNYKDPSIGISNRVYVQYTDSLLETFCYRGEKKIRTKDDLFYYWYAAQDIKHTRGAYGGKILHGTFTMFYYNKDLRSKGQFKYGLKKGIWKSWYQGGEIKSKEKWKAGRLVGKAFYYSNKGLIQNETNIKQRTGNGYVLFFDDKGKVKSKEIYKNNILEKEILFQKNKRGKLVEIKPSHIKSEKVKSTKLKSLFHKNRQVDKQKKVKSKKQKEPKIKIHKYREVLPGGAGA